MIDWTKPVQTIEGKYPCIVHQVQNEKYPILLEFNDGDEWKYVSLTSEGALYQDLLPFVENVPGGIQPLGHTDEV